MKSVLQLLQRVTLFLAFSLPISLLAQNPGDPGTNPDARPQDVPFSGSMSWILIAAGVVLVVVVLRRVMHKKAVA
jgi:hypothetical protein